MDRTSGLVDRTSSSQAKLALFRSLFRGREDIYPRRFESRKTGKAGYAPACANEWVRGICEKPRIKCAECPNRRFLPVTDEVIRWHLSGYDPDGQPFVAGVYPLQKGPRKQDNSVLLDDHFVPWTDQWAFLASARKIGRAQVERIVQNRLLRLAAFQNPEFYKAQAMQPRAQTGRSRQRRLPKWSSTCCATTRAVCRAASS